MSVESTLRRCSNSQQIYWSGSFGNTEQARESTGLTKRLYRQQLVSMHQQVRIHVYPHVFMYYYTEQKNRNHVTIMTGSMQPWNRTWVEDKKQIVVLIYSCTFVYVICTARYIYTYNFPGVDSILTTLSVQEFFLRRLLNVLLRLCSWFSQ